MEKRSKKECKKTWTCIEPLLKRADWVRGGSLRLNIQEKKDEEKKVQKYKAKLNRTKRCNKCPTISVSVVRKGIWIHWDTLIKKWTAIVRVFFAPIWVKKTIRNSTHNSLWVLHPANTYGSHLKILLFVQNFNPVILPRGKKPFKHICSYLWKWKKWFTMTDTVCNFCKV